MVNYNNGKIYKIVDFSNKNFYVGSTAQPKLCSRLGEHVSKFNCYMRGTNPKYCASMEILINENYKIFLLETYPCNSKDELNMKEQEHMDKLRCEFMVNKQDAYVSKEDMLIKQKKYQEEHKEHLKEKAKEYREEHKEEISIRKKERRKDNHELILEQERTSYHKHKEQKNERSRQFRKDNPDFVKNRENGYYQKHKDKKNARKREKIECPNCKSIVSRGNLTEHKRTQRCIDFVEKMT